MVARKGTKAPGQPGEGDPLVTGADVAVGDGEVPGAEGVDDRAGEDEWAGDVVPTTGGTGTEVGGAEVGAGTEPDGEAGGALVVDEAGVEAGAGAGCWGLDAPGSGR